MDRFRLVSQFRGGSRIGKLPPKDTVGDENHKVKYLPDIK